MLGIEHLQRRFHHAVNQLRLERSGLAGKAFSLADGAHHALGRLQHFAVFFAIRLRQRQQHASEAGTPVIILRRKICSAIKRLAFRREKRRKRPAALPADGLHRGLVAAVHVGALVAIHLDRDEMLIHDLRDLRIS